MKMIRKEEIKFGNIKIEIIKSFTGYIIEIREIKDNEITIKFKRRYIPIISDIKEIILKLILFIFPVKIKFIVNGNELIFKKRWFSSFDEFLTQSWEIAIRKYHESR